MSLSPKSVPGGNSGGFFTTQHPKPVRSTNDTEIQRGLDGHIISVKPGNGQVSTAILKQPDTSDCLGGGIDP
jgi:hypothetical protein